MELDDLKGAWKRQVEQSTKDVRSDEELLAMLRIKAISTIDLLKKSVLFELWSSLICVAACFAVVTISVNPSTQVIAVIAGVISCGFGFYYYNKLLLLKKINIENRSIKENLSHLIIKFEKFLWFYRWGYNYLIPFALLAGALVGVYVSNEQNFIGSITKVKLWLVLTAVIVPIAILFNYAMKWYLKKLYGNHISKLRFLLKDLEN